MGSTEINDLDYNIGHLAMLPGTIVYVFIGTTASDVASALNGRSDYGLLTMIIAIVGSILAIGGIVYISIFATRILNEELKDEELKDVVDNLEDIKVEE